MKIVLITDIFFPYLGGITHTLVNLYNFIQEKGEEIYIFNPTYKDKNIFNVMNNRKDTIRNLLKIFNKKKFYFYLIHSFWKILRDKKISQFHRLNIISYLIIKPKALIETIDNIRRLSQYLTNLDFDLIVSSNSGNILILAVFLGTIFNKKVVTLAHGNDFLAKKAIHLKSSYFKSVEKIIVNSTKMRQFIRKIYNLNEEKLIVINRAISLKDSEIQNSKLEIRKELNLSDDDFIILSVGRQNFRKNFDLVIRSIERILKIRPSIKIKYYLIGSGLDTQNLKDLTRKLNLEDKVFFLGNCNNELRNKFYKLSDLFIMPSIMSSNTIEGFGIVFLEANFYNLPVIGTRSGGIPEAIIEGKTGYLIKPEDLEDLIDKIMILYDNEDLRLEMGQAGHDRVINEFLWENIIEIYLKTFKKVLLS
ncbi:MAG: glycosyltransferase family 4 protein [Promethearchaeota archaeon]